MKYLMTVVIVSLYSALVLGQVTISGHVYDKASGESIIAANVIDLDNPVVGAATNVYGFYSLTLPVGSHTISYSYLGFEEQRLAANFTQDTTINIYLSQGLTLEEVVVTSEEIDQNISETKMGTVKLATEEIKAIPALFGEVDVLKTLQLLPGVSSAGEGGSGFYVRGGSGDQNLILLDEAIVYNSGHLLGFFSVFNADAIKNTTLIKGNMPAQYGGRLSSVVDIQMKEGNDQHLQLKGGIGTVSSRLTIEGPIKKNKSSFIVSARRTYALDLAQPFINNTDFKGTNYFFYDLNAKANYRFSEKDRIFFSGYFGRDVFKFNQPVRNFAFRLPYGNSTATGRWNHIFSPKLFSNLSVIYNDYEFEINGEQDDFNFKVFSSIRDINGKLDFDWFPNYKHMVKYGANYTWHTIAPNSVQAADDENQFTNDLKSKRAHDLAFYLQDTWKINGQWTIDGGLRYSLYMQVGPYDSPLGTQYKSGEIAKTYGGLEPRLNVKFQPNNLQSIKFGYARTFQYLHLVSNSGNTLPADVWVSSSDLIKPQDANQWALGYFRNINDNAIELSVETFYKKMNNQIDYPENYVNNASIPVEESFVFGSGEAYGIELFARKQKGKFTGWIGYTLSKSTRTFDDIQGITFPASFDRRHDVSVVASYQINKKWQVNGIFVYGSGRPYTPIKNIYLIDQEAVINYADRNSGKLPDYHRLDLGATWVPKPDSEKKFKSSFTFSIYNVYNRKNPFFLNYESDVDLDAGTITNNAYQISIFPIIPAITWNFKLN